MDEEILTWLQEREKEKAMINVATFNRLRLEIIVGNRSRDVAEDAESFVDAVYRTYVEKDIEEFHRLCTEFSYKYDFNHEVMYILFLMKCDIEE
jgi:hypothetical protein